MGSEFIKRGIPLPPHVWSAQLNLDAPEIIYKIHLKLNKFNILMKNVVN